MASDVWVVAGAPLAGGTGWRIWYSWAEGEPASPPADPRPMFQCVDEQQRLWFLTRSGHILWFSARTLMR